MTSAYLACTTRRLSLRVGGEFLGFCYPSHGQQVPLLDLLHPGQPLVGGGDSSGHFGEHLRGRTA